MKRFAAIGLIAIGALTIPVAAQDKQVPLDIRAMSTRPEFASGGDVLLQISGPSNLTVKNLTVHANGKDVSAAFKPAPDSRMLVGLVTGLNVGSNAVTVSMKGNKATAQLTVV